MTVGADDATHVVGVCRTNPARHMHSTSPRYPNSAQYVVDRSQPCVPSVQWLNVGRRVGTGVGAVGAIVVGVDVVGTDVGAWVGAVVATQLVSVRRMCPARHSHSMTPPPRSAQYVEVRSQPWDPS